MSFLIAQNASFTPTELTALRNLADACSVFDNVEPKIYWDIIKRKREISGNFLYYQDTQLIGYLSFFLFEAGAVNISAIVHPAFRRQHIFKKLFQAAQHEISQLNIFKIIFSFPQENESARKVLVSLGASFQSSEYRMERNNHILEKIEKNSIAIKLAGKNDIPLITSIDIASFESDPVVMLQRYTETSADPQREIWLAYLGNECIGKAHIHLDETRAVIHDVAIIPAQQNKGYGLQLLQQMINHLICKEHYLIHLDVIATNESALKLYQKCRFKVVTVDEYWQLNINKLIEK